MTRLPTLFLPGPQLGGRPLSEAERQGQGVALVEGPGSPRRRSWLGATSAARHATLEPSESIIPEVDVMPDGSLTEGLASKDGDDDPTVVVVAVTPRSGRAGGASPASPYHQHSLPQCTGVHLGPGHPD